MKMLRKISLFLFLIVLISISVSAGRILVLNDTYDRIDSVNLGTSSDGIVNYIEDEPTGEQVHRITNNQNSGVQLYSGGQGGIAWLSRVDTEKFDVSGKGLNITFNLTKVGYYFTWIFSPDGVSDCTSYSIVGAGVNGFSIIFNNGAEFPYHQFANGTTGSPWIQAGNSPLTLGEISIIVNVSHLVLYDDGVKTYQFQHNLGGYDGNIVDGTEVYIGRNAYNNQPWHRFDDLLIYAEFDDVEPSFSNQERNKTPSINEYLRLNITITDDNADSYRFFWNETGSFQNDSAQSYTSGIAVATTKQVTTAHQYICWGYWANDTNGNEDVSSLDCFIVGDTSPAITIISPYDSDHNYINLTSVASCNDVDGDGMSMTLNVNSTVSDVTNASIDDGVSTSLTTTDMTVDGHYSWYINCSSSYGYSTSTPRLYVLDTITPILTVLSPENDSWYEADETFDLNISGEDLYIYLLNYTIYNSSGDIKQSNQVENISSITYLSINDTIDIDSLGFSDGELLYINISTSDLHTGTDISKLDKLKKGDVQFLVIDETLGIEYNMSLEFEKDKIKEAKPTVIGSYLDFSADSTKLNFGIDYTNNKKGIHPIFKIKTTNVPIQIISNSEYLGHLIWYPYGTDFEGTLLVNDVEMVYDTEIVFISNYEVDVRIIPDIEIENNDVVQFDFDSIYGLSIIETQYVINVGEECFYSCTLFDTCQPDITGGYRDCIGVNETVECVYDGDYSEFQGWCDYCIIGEEATSGECIDHLRLWDYTLTNNETCCELTGNESDCDISNSYNTSCGYIKRFSGGDLSGVSIDIIIGILAVFFSFVAIIGIVLIYVYIVKPRLKR